MYLWPLWPKLASDHHGLLIIPIHLHHCLLSTCSWCVWGVFWSNMAAVASSGGCCTLVVDEEIPPFYVKCFEYPEKLYINVTNYYYYKYLPFYFPLFFVTLKGFIIGNLVWLYCSDNSQNSKTSMTKNRDRIMLFKKKKSWYYIFPYRPPLVLGQY